MSLLLLLLGLAAQPASQPISWTNPLVMQRADPHVIHADGQYLLTATVPEYDRIEIRRAATLGSLRDATPRVIWKRHASGPMSWHVWAPELHRIDGKWYVYFAAGRADDIWAIRMYVLENASPDPFTGTWIEKGQIKTTWETFALDATTFVHRGARYLAWAQKDPDIKGNTNLYLAKMDTPWSIVGEPVRLSKPDHPWEQVKYWVNEGPAVLIRNGRVFMTYSASATNEYYCMGLLTADANADLLDPAAWHKSPKPVFATWSVSGVFGPGHNSFTTTPDGSTDVMVYHARSYREITGHELNNPDRHTRAQPIAWRPDGTPDFGVPVPDGPLPGQAPTYLFSYFTGNGEDGLHFAESTDGLTWTAVAGGRSFLKPAVGSRLMRDPSIVRGPDGVFHLVWTTGWWDKGIGLAHSKDLIEWSEQQFVPVMEHERDAQNCWAPEIFFDEDGGRYLIFWSTTIPGRFPDTEPKDPGLGRGDRANHRIYYIETKDFRTFSNATLLYDGGFNVIDGFIIRAARDRYAMIVKDETVRPTPKKHLRLAEATRPEGPYGPASGPVSIDWVEGPSALKIGSDWIVYYDEYTRKRYGAIRSRDLKTWAPVRDVSFPPGARHGTAFAVPTPIAARLGR